MAKLTPDEGKEGATSSPWTKRAHMSVVDAIHSPLPQLSARAAVKLPGGQSPHVSQTKASPPGILFEGSPRHDAASGRRAARALIQPAPHGFTVAEPLSAAPLLARASLAAPLQAAARSSFSQGVLFTDSKGFIKSSSQLRRPEPVEDCLQSLWSHGKPTSPDTVQDPLDAPVTPAASSPTVVKASKEHPGEGINASAAVLAAPASWEQVKKSMLGQVLRARRISANDDLKFELQSLSPDAPKCKVQPHKILEMLKDVPWFKRISNTKMRHLLRRSALVYFEEGQTILRENSYGSAFYLLLEGQTMITSKARNIDVTQLPGSFFGESALAVNVHVRREASVEALENSWCLRVNAIDVTELGIELDELKKIYLAKALSRVRWFDMLTASKLSALGRIMEIESFPPNRVIFGEGEMADKMYIVISGRVTIFKRRVGGTPQPSDRVDPTDSTWAKQNMLLAEFSPQSKSPWFGEVAIFDQSPRSASAFTVESTELLSVHMSQAKRLIQLIPEFFQMNAAYRAAYNVTNQLNGTEKAPSHIGAKMTSPIAEKRAAEKPAPVEVKKSVLAALAG